MKEIEDKSCKADLTYTGNSNDTEIIISNRIDNVANANDFLNTLTDEMFKKTAITIYDESEYD